MDTSILIPTRRSRCVVRRRTGGTRRSMEKKTTVDVTPSGCSRSCLAAMTSWGCTSAEPSPSPPSPFPSPSLAAAALSTVQIDPQ